MGGISRKTRRQALRAMERQAPRFDANDLGLPKMSQVLIHVAQPLLAGIELPEQEDDFRVTLLFASAVWNVSRLPSEKERQDALEALLTVDGQRMDAETEAMVRRTFRRARTFHPLDPRTIERTDVHCDDDGEYRVVALASLVVPRGAVPE